MGLGNAGMTLGQTALKKIWLVINLAPCRRIETPGICCALFRATFPHRPDRGLAFKENPLVIRKGDFHS